MSADLRQLVDDMRVATSMNSPAGMAQLLTEGAAALEEILDQEKLTVEDLMAQAALGPIMEAWLKDVNLLREGDDDRMANMAYDAATAMMARRKR